MKKLLYVFVVTLALSTQINAKNTTVYPNEALSGTIKPNGIFLQDALSYNAEQDVKDLSKLKWDWMSNKNVDSLSVLFDDKCNFVHMGGTWGKEREIEIIKGGFIWYKKAEVYSSSIQFFGNMAILLNEIDLVAMVGGREAINPFMVTEVYFKENGRWKMGQLTFSHLSRPLKLKTESPQQ